MVVQNKPWFVYVLQCQGGSLYIGITTDPCRRWKQHITGKGAKYTKMHKALEMRLFWSNCTETEARQTEYLLKQMTAIKKRELWQDLLPFLVRDSGESLLPPKE